MALPDWMLPIKKELDTKIEAHCERLLKIRMEKIEKQGRMLLDMGYQLSDLTIIRYSDGRELQWEVWPVSLVEHKTKKVADFTWREVQEWMKKVQPTMGVDMGKDKDHSARLGYVQVLQWQHHNPTTEGYYWLRRHGSPDRIVSVEIRSGGVAMWYDAAIWRTIEGTYNLWAGPIAPPIASQPPPSA